MNEIPEALRLMASTLDRMADVLERLEEIESSSPLTVDEVAKAVRVDERTVREYIKSGRLRAFKVGAHWRIPRSALAELMEGESR